MVDKLKDTVKLEYGMQCTVYFCPVYSVFLLYQCNTFRYEGVDRGNQDRFMIMGHSIHNESCTWFTGWAQATGV